KATPMRIENRSIFDCAFWDDPHGRYSAGVFLNVIDATGLGRERLPMALVPFNMFLGVLGALGCDCYHGFIMYLIHLALFACHSPAPVIGLTGVDLILIGRAGTTGGR